MSNSNGTNIPPVNNSSAAALNSAGTESYNPGSPTTSPPPISVVDLATISNATFSSLTDPAHPNTENCFTFKPSIIVQGIPSTLCDCGSTTATLTTHGSTTGCALNQTIFAIDQFQTGTATVAASQTISATVAAAQTISATVAVSQTTTATVAASQTMTSASRMYPRVFLQGFKGHGN